MNFKSLLSICTVLLIIAGCQNILNEEVSQDSVLDNKVNEDFFENANRLDFKSLEQGYWANTTEQNVVISTEERFTDLWASLHSNKNPLPDIPNVDFDIHMVLVSVMGTKPSGGYVVEITQVGLLNDTLGVKVRNKSPGGGCVTTGALTTPYHMVKIEKSNKPVEFFEEEIAVDCGS